jgi:serine/threonine-protein kinase
MGVVHLGRLDGRPVAVKRLHPALAADAWYVRLLRDEGRFAASICHPNVVRCVGLVEDAAERTPALVMEWIDGVDLATLWRTFARAGRRLPVGVAVAIVRDVLAGLAAVHETRIDEEALALVHRDVSPQNILVGFDGRARLTDFGVATVVRKTPTEDPPVAGKLGYAAPEQLEGPVDPRSDLYATGVVLWELLTGKRYRPSAGTGMVARTFRRHATPPSVENPDAREFDDVVLCALQPDPADRFVSARAMGDRLVAGTSPAAPELVSAVLRDGIAVGPVPSRTLDGSDSTIRATRRSGSALTRPVTDVHTVARGLPAGPTAWDW